MNYKHIKQEIIKDYKNIDVLNFSMKEIEKFFDVSNEENYPYLMELRIRVILEYKQNKRINIL